MTKKIDYSVLLSEILILSVKDYLHRPRFKKWKNNYQRQLKLNVLEKNRRKAEQFIFSPLFLKWCDAFNLNGEWVRKKIVETARSAKIAFSDEKFRYYKPVGTRLRGR